MTWNWAQVVEDNKDAAKAFDIITPGKYATKVEQAEAKTSSNGNPMLEIRLRITEGQFASRLVFFRATATEKSQGIFLRNLAAFGITSEWLVTAEPSFDEIANALVGREAIAEVILDKWQGQERNSVKNVSPKAGGAAPAAAAAAVAAPAAPSPFDAPAAAQQAAPAQDGPWGAPAPAANPAAPANPFGSAPASPF